MASKSTLEIVGGPSRFDLMLALFDAPMDRSRRVVFDVRHQERRGKAEALIMDVGRSRPFEDIDLWTIGGSILLALADAGKRKLHLEIDGWLRFEGEFSTKTREGTMEAWVSMF